VLKILGDLIAEILTVGGIAGVIAIMITFTICARYIEHVSEEIPQILTYSLSTIIGFYFGTGVAKPTTDNHALANPAANQIRTLPIRPAACNKCDCAGKT
jgi:hypothetical protein